MLAAALFLVAGAAQAGPILPTADVTGFISGGGIENNAFLNAPGSSSVLPNPYAAGTISAVLGISPTVSIDFTVFNPDPAFNNSGAGIVSLRYYVQYDNPGADPGATININFQTRDTLSQSGAALARSYLLLSGPDVSYQLTHCITNSALTGCSGALLETGAPFPTSTPLTLQQNKLYSVFMQVDVSGVGIGGVSGIAHAEIDPMFIPLQDLGGQFVFSPGVGSVPEPGTWALMLAGFGGVGAYLRRRRALAV